MEVTFWMRQKPVCVSRTKNNAPWDICHTASVRSEVLNVLAFVDIGKGLLARQKGLRIAVSIGIQQYCADSDEAHEITLEPRLAYIYQLKLIDRIRIEKDCEVLDRRTLEKSSVDL